MQPLSGIRVLDLSRTLVGPFASQILADFGAEVIKVEDISGEPGRTFMPSRFGEKNSLSFYYLNRHKKSIAIDLRQKEGQDILKKLVTSGDVLLENFVPGTMQKLGLDYSVLKEINPKLIYCATTGYGSTGPMQKTPCHDLNILSVSGITGLTGIKNQPPGMLPIQLGSNAGASLHAVIAILLALKHRDQTGIGQFCDISMLDGTLTLLVSALAEWNSCGQLPERGNEVLTGRYAYYQVYETKDHKYLSLAAVERKFWNTFCTRIGHPEFIPIQKDPKIQTALIASISKIIAEKTQAEWLDFFDGVNICLSPVLDLDEVCTHPQIVARNMIINMENFESTGKDVKIVSSPIKLSECPFNPQLDFPELGQHTIEVLSEVGYSKTDIKDLLEKKTIA